MARVVVEGLIPHKTCLTQTQFCVNHKFAGFFSSLGNVYASRFCWTLIWYFIGSADSQPFVLSISCCVEILFLAFGCLLCFGLNFQEKSQKDLSTKKTNAEQRHVHTKSFVSKIRWKTTTFWQYSLLLQNVKLSGYRKNFHCPELKTKTA